MASTLKESDLDVKTRRGIYGYQMKSLVLVCDKCFIYSTLPCLKINTMCIIFIQLTTDLAVSNVKREECQKHYIIHHKFAMGYKTNSCDMHRHAIFFIKHSPIFFTIAYLLCDCCY